MKVSKLILRLDSIEYKGKEVGHVSSRKEPWDWFEMFSRPSSLGGLVPSRNSISLQVHADEIGTKNEPGQMSFPVQDRVLHGKEANDINLAQKYENGTPLSL